MSRTCISNDISEVVAKSGFYPRISCRGLCVNYTPRNAQVAARLCTHKVVSERFHNSQNEDDANHKNPHGIKFLVFVLRRGLCWFLLNCVNRYGAFLNNSEWKRSETTPRARYQDALLLISGCVHIVCFGLTVTSLQQVVTTSLMQVVSTVLCS